MRYDIFAGQSVSPIDEQRSLDERGQAAPVYLSKFVPLGKQQNRIGSLGRFIGILAVGYIWNFFLRFFHGLGVVGSDQGSLSLQAANDGERGREAGVQELFRAGGG